MTIYVSYKLPFSLCMKCMEVPSSSTHLHRAHTPFTFERFQMTLLQYWRKLDHREKKLQGPQIQVARSKLLGDLIYTCICFSLTTSHISLYIHNSFEKLGNFNHFKSSSTCSRLFAKQSLLYLQATS